MSPREKEPRPPEGVIAEPQRARRVANLDKANAQRKVIKQLRVDIRDERVDDVALVKGDLAEYEPIVTKWPVERLLKACYDIGPVRAFQIMSVARVSPSKRVGDLSWERRMLLARLVEEARDSQA